MVHLRHPPQEASYANATDLIARESARKTPFPQWLIPVFIPTAKLMAKGIYGIDIGELAPERSVADLVKSSNVERY